MKKNILLILIIIMMIQAKGFGQLVVNKSPYQEMFENTISSGLFISSQSYQICRKSDNNLFGRNGKNEFNIIYSLGIKTKTGFLLQKQAITPWDFDETFENYKNEYDPVFYQSKFTELSKSPVFKTLPLDGKEEICNTFLYQFNSELFEKNGFLIDNDKGEKKGWIAILCADIQGDTLSKFSFTIYQNKINLEGNNQTFPVNKIDTNQLILGGVYVVPYYTNIGTIEFRLCGVITQVENDWKILCPFVNSGDNTAQIELTPINQDDNQNKKKKKK